MPWHYVRFLEEATERILLQRVGGGYRFIHPLFLDYFASLATPTLSYSVEKPSSRQPQLVSCVGKKRYLGRYYPESLPLSNRSSLATITW
jgi:hypothetical protein